MRYAPAFLALLLLTLPALAVGEEPAAVYAASAAAKPLRKPPALRVLYRLPAGLEPSDAPGVRTAKLGRTKLLFVDVDGNGRFGDLGTDGWTVRRMPAAARVHYVFPLGDALVLGADVVRYRVASDGSRVEFTRIPAELSAPVRAGLEQLNRLRLRNGLPPVPADPTRSLACVKHIRYMTIHDAYGHEEIEGRRGWSKDGAYAGIHSVIDTRVTLADASIRWFATLYHRVPIADPRLVSVGAALAKPYTMLSPILDRADTSWVWPVLVPAPDSEDQPTRAGTERPLPYPATEEVGYPITLQFPAWASAVENVTGVLRRNGPKGPEVACTLSSPLAPAHPTRGRNDGTIALIPKAPLASKALYWVQVDFVWDGQAQQRTWTFRTGKDRRPPGNSIR